MSSTNRGKKGGGDAEFFGTPFHIVHRLLERLVLPGGLWLEPSAGDGAIIRAVNEVRQDVNWRAIEIRKECMEPLHTIWNCQSVMLGSFQNYARANALREDGQDAFSVVIMNPPFSQAFIFVQRALELAEHVVCLQRINWLFDSEACRLYFRDHVPDIYAVGRTDFDGRGGDSASYAWFHWREGQANRETGNFHILDKTPRAERIIGALPPPRQGRLL